MSRLIIGLVGARLCGRDTIARHLKRAHGFVAAALEQAPTEAMYSLFGLSPLDVLGDGKDVPLTRFQDRTARDLISMLAESARVHAGRDILIRRLVNRAVARGDWPERDFVITDVSQPEELRWLRSLGGFAWWVRRSAVDCSLHELAATQKLMHAGFDPRADSVIANDGSMEQLLELTDRAVMRSQTVRDGRRELAAIPSP